MGRSVVGAVVGVAGGGVAVMPPGRPIKTCGKGLETVQSGSGPGQWLEELSPGFRVAGACSKREVELQGTALNVHEMRAVF